MSPCEPSSPVLADFLQARRDDITRQWEERVRGALPPRVLSPGELVDTLPEFLEALVAVLRGRQPPQGPDAPPPPGAIAESHGCQRYQAGFDIATVVREYSLLRDVIFEVLRESPCPLSPETLRPLTDALATAAAVAVRRYAQEHERALRLREGMQRERDEARERLQRILTSLPIILWAYDTRGVLTLCEGKGLESLGVGPGEFVGCSLWELYADKPPLLAALQRALGGEALSLEMEHAGAWFDMRLHPEFGPDGRVVGGAGLALDITERRRTELELRQSETRYRLATLATSDIIWDWDVSNQTVHWSENLQRFLGGRMDPALSEWAARIHPEDRQRVVRGLRAAIEGDAEHWTDEYRLRREDGSYLFVNDRGYVLRDGQGRAVRMVGAVEDITQRKLAEQLARRRADFEQHLIGIVSHDLRNPLNAISMSAGLLLRQDRLEEPQRRALQRIIASAERATRMLRDLLDFTQARLSGSLPVEPRSLNLHELTRQVVEEVQLAHPTRQLVLEQRGNGQGTWDADRLAQLITNLVSNALAYGLEHCAVRVRTRGQQDAVLLSVHNEGPPIPAELMPRLFEPLKRGERTEGRSGHSIGLGLFIVKHIVDAHGGYISVHSNETNGTTFTVRLPRHPPPGTGSPRP